MIVDLSRSYSFILGCIAGENSAERLVCLDVGLLESVIAFLPEQGGVVLLL